MKVEVPGKPEMVSLWIQAALRNIRNVSHKWLVKIAVGILEKYFAYTCEDERPILKRKENRGLINADASNKVHKNLFDFQDFH